MSFGQRLDRDLARDLLEDAALLDARDSSAPVRCSGDRRLDRLVEVDAQQVDVHHVAAHGVQLGVLQDGRRGLAAERDVEHGAAAGERQAKIARVDGERLRLVAHAVQHAGHAALAAQPPRRARMRGATRFDVQRCGLTLGHCGAGW